jgi:mRNA interferase YafQ
MRRIEITGAFKRDIKRTQSNPKHRNLDSILSAVLDMLAQDIPLAARYHDHRLTGEWNDFRDCHLKPDLVLIYRKIGEDALQLARIGSHSELGF